MGKTLKFGNGTWATKKGSTLAYSDTNNAFKPLPFTYTGAGKGTRVNKEGLIEVVENDRPRIDYTDSEDGVFLLEKAATNLVTYSEQFDNAYWTKSGASLTSGFVSPDGTNNAFKLTTSSVSNVLKKIPLSSVDVGNTNSPASFSFYIKSDEISKVSIVEEYYYSAWASFDLNLGTVIASGGSNYTSSSIQSLSNGWYRITILLTSISNGVMSIGIRLLDNNYINQNATTYTYSGNIGDGVYIYGGQAEASSQSSSYIPTQGNPQTRVQETASGSGNSEVFNDSEGVLFFEGSALANDLTNRFISLTDGSNDNRVLFGYRSASNQIFARIEGNNSASVDLTTVSSDTKINAKITISYDSSYNYKMFVNGFLVDSGVGTDGIIGLDRLDFTNASGTENFYGKTKEIAYYDEILTDLELETLTSYRSWEAMVKELNLNIIHNE